MKCELHLIVRALDFCQGHYFNSETLEVYREIVDGVTEEEVGEMLDSKGDELREKWLSTGEYDEVAVDLMYDDEI